KDFSLHYHFQARMRMAFCPCAIGMISTFDALLYSSTAISGGRFSLLETKLVIQPSCLLSRMLSLIMSRTIFFSPPSHQSSFGCPPKFCTGSDSLFLCSAWNFWLVVCQFSAADL